MARNPSVMSTWLTWLSTGPAKAYVAAAITQAVVESFSARRKTYMLMATPEKRITSVAIQAARSGRPTKRAMSG